MNIGNLQIDRQTDRHMPGFFRLLLAAVISGVTPGRHGGTCPQPLTGWSVAAERKEKKSRQGRSQKF